MQPARNLVVFVRAPRRGTVKRRLAADIGAVAARRFYARTMADLLARVGRASDLNYIRAPLAYLRSLHETL